jgi:hypothetical protein
VVLKTRFLIVVRGMGGELRFTQLGLASDGAQRHSADGSSDVAIMDGLCAVESVMLSVQRRLEEVTAIHQRELLEFKRKMER